MNTGILKKVIEELGKEDPKLDYVRGMLETLYLMSSETELKEVYTNTHGEYPKKVLVPAAPLAGGSHDLDEGAALDAHARAAISTVQALSEASQDPI